MKALSALTLLAAAAALVMPNKAMAGDKEKAIIGGLIGGIIIGAVIADDDFDTHVNVGYHAGGRHGHHDHGYWEWVSVKTWIPGYYERSCDRYGRTRKVWISGHYTFSKKKVWVDARRSSHRSSYHYRSYDRHDRRHDRYDHRDDRRDHRRNDRYDDRGNRSDRRDGHRTQPVRRF
ncbi:hypothetical protein VDG1235_1496 [Verrucomicrobiia bacterium DG1235]|nr:hypothetical protein VDG1235_1496 [Verrucomicrobiae bacterium DG1235]